MIINRNALLTAAPIKNMMSTKEKHKGVSHGLSEAGYDIRLKQDVHFKWDKNGNPQVIVIQDEGLKVTYNGSFALASAIEEFQMPNDLVAIVHDKSSWARKGLSVFNTVIEPGWNGFLTLELVHHGNEELFIPAGSGIAQVIFHEIIQESEYNGKYQNQEDKPIPAIIEID